MSSGLGKQQGESSITTNSQPELGASAGGGMPMATQAQMRDAFDRCMVAHSSSRMQVIANLMEQANGLTSVLE